MNKNLLKGIAIGVIVTFGVFVIGIITLSKITKKYDINNYVERNDQKNINLPTLKYKYTRGKITNLIDTIPISDVNALKNLNNLYYIDISVEGTVKDKTYYEIFLTENEDNTIDSSNVKIYLVGLDNKIVIGPILYSKLSNGKLDKTKNSKVIYNDMVLEKVAEKFRIYSWLDENYKSTFNNPSFSFNVGVEVNHN